MTPRIVDMSQYHYPTAKARSPTGRDHHLAVPEPPRAKKTSPMRSNGTAMATPNPEMKPQSSGVAVGDSRRRRSVRPRSEESRDPSPAPVRKRISYPPTPLPDRTKAPEDRGTRSTKGKAVRFSTQTYHDGGSHSRDSAGSSKSLRSIGSWCEPTPRRAPQLLPEAFREPKARNPLPTPPMTPYMGRLDTPDLAPLAFDTEFCACCGDEQDMVNETWCLTGRDKYDVQLDEARAYIAKVSARVDRLLLP